MLRDNAITLKGIAAWDGMYLNVTLEKSVLQATAVTVTIVLPASEKGHVFNFNFTNNHPLHNSSK